MTRRNGESILRTPVLCAALVAATGLCSAGPAPEDRPAEKPQSRTSADQTSDDPAERIYLDGSASRDPDGDAITYRWKQLSGPAVKLEEADAARPWFVPPGAGTYVFQLVVSDRFAASAPAEVRVVVEKHNRRPIARAGGDFWMQPGSEAVLDGRASFDLDGEKITYRWVQTGGSRVKLRGADRAVCRLTPTEFGEYRFALVVSDGTLESEPARVVVSVRAPNHRPRADAGPDRAVKAIFGARTPDRLGNTHPVVRVAPGRVYPLGSRVVLDASASYDADGDELHFFWTPESGPVTVRRWQPVKGSKNHARIQFFASEPGEYVWRVQVSDGLADSDWATVRVLVRADNAAPTAEAGKDLTVFAGEQVVLDGSASRDPDGDRLLYAWKQRSGPQVQRAFQAAADSVRPRFVARQPGEYVFELTVGDRATWSKPDTVMVRVLPPNRPPAVFAAERPIACRVGEAVILRVDAEDPEGEALTYHWQQRAGARMRLGSVKGRPAERRFVARAPGTYVFRVRVSDDKVAAAPRLVTVHVSGGRDGRPPVARVESPVHGMVGAKITLDGSQSFDPDGDEIAFQWTREEGAAVRLHEAKGARPWFVPPAAGRYRFGLTVADRHFKTLPQTVTVIVRADNQRPVAEAKRE